MAHLHARYKKKRASGRRVDRIIRQCWSTLDENPKFIICKTCLKQARDSILDVILDSLFSILDLRRNRENRVENRDSQRTVNLLLNGTVHIISHKDIAEVG